MTKPRAQQISLEATPYYHCISRCVRKAYLCGKNYDESIDYEHRRSWIEQRLFELSRIFMIDIVSYAIMSNHYHVILAVDQKGADDLTDKEVVKRWHRLFSGTAASNDFISGNPIPATIKSKLKNTIDEWRERLMSISWFMRCVNEDIARRANEEDECTGRFWEGRFKSQALLDDKALLACMAYVDLNPVRANMSDSLANSEFTSIKKRLANKASKKVIIPERVLMPFSDEKQDETQRTIPCSFSDYVKIVEDTGRQFRGGKIGCLSSQSSLLLKNIDISRESWFYLTDKFENRLKTVVGGSEALNDVYCSFSIKRIAGKIACLKYFGT